MPKVVGVRFKEAGKIYHFDPGDLQDLQVDEYVIVETARGYEAAQVALEPQDIPNDQVVGHLKEVTRRATTADLLSRQHYAMEEAQAIEQCREKVAEYKLPMKIVGAEYSFDGSSLVFFFTADKRIDFRELVRELARMFRTRIELRQIGVRDEAKLIGGIGPCGRQLCCCTHLCEFRPVSIKMAKQQNLPLSPMEISGLCGRLLCCLSYEDDYYTEAKRLMPRRGDIVSTEHGQGRVVGVNVIQQTVQVSLGNEVTVEVPWHVPELDLGLGEEPAPEPEEIAEPEEEEEEEAPLAEEPQPQQAARPSEAPPKERRRRSRRRRPRRGGK